MERGKKEIMVILKELVPLFMLVIALLEIGLESKWRDKRTKIHKIWRKILIGVLICSTIATMIIIDVDHRKAKSIEEKIDNIPNKFKDIVKGINRENYKEYYDQAKFNYEAGIFYQQLGINAKSATAFLLSKDIALKMNQLQPAAIFSLIAACRFEDIKDFSKAGELQVEAGDLYIRMNDIREAILWKRQALGNYRKAKIIEKINEIEKEIFKLQSDLTAQ